MIISLDVLQEIDSLQERNLNLQAYELSKQFGKFSVWEGSEALLLASHLSYNLGAQKESCRLTARAWRANKADPKVIFYKALELMQSRGPLPTLMFMRKFPDYRADAKLTSWWFSLYGQLHSSLRDFVVAEEFHNRAIETCPNEPWVWVSKSFTFEQQDRLDEALDAAIKGLGLGPMLRSTVSSTAHYLTLLERDDEALKLLTGIIGKVENAWLVKQLAELQTEMGMHAEAYATVNRMFDLLPLLEDETGEWLYGSLSDSAYLTGNLEEAVEYAKKAGSPFYEKIVENIKSAKSDAKRVQLDVGFLRQHHVTCAPATLSNIARYWKKKADHLELVEDMCYDGTPSYKERAWADNNGWKTKEFTLNWGNATEMLERGVPLTLATVYPGGGHLQAIIGFDERRGTYLIRDPYFQRTGEFAAEELEEQQRSSGPRVMALVPEEREELLEDLESELVEHDIYDLLYKIEGALDTHDRERAEILLKEIGHKYPDHRLNFSARWTVSNYDSNTLGVRAAMQRLLDLFPGDVNLKLNDIGVSAQFTSRGDRLRKLEEYAKAESTDPLIWQTFGDELGRDAKQHRRALRWLFRALRKAPGNAFTYRGIADILWSQRRFAESSELYRIAASLNDKDENFTYAYFLAMRHLKREDEALSILADRSTRFTKQSGMPVRSLFLAQREMGMIKEAFASLEGALSERPKDGDLHLFVADAMARFGKISEADALLGLAEAISPRQQWLKISATVAHLKGDLQTAIMLWRQVLETDPTAFDVHENIAFLTKGLEGTLAVKEYLRRVCRKFPTNRSLQTLRLQYLDEEPSEAIAILRDLIRSDPGDIWSHRELSHWYAQLGKLDKSLEVADAALSIDPSDAVSHWFRGKALEALNRYDEAADEYKKAVKNSADHAYAIHNWIDLLRTKEQKVKALDSIWEEVKEHSITGEGLLAFWDEARRFFEPSVLLEKLKGFHADNRRSWFGASAVIQQLVDMGETAEALDVAIKAVERFPLVHQIWLDLALIHKLTGNRDEEISALRNAVAMNPAWSYGSQQLTDALQRAGGFSEAKDVLTDALARLPFDHFLHGYLSEVYWKLNDRDKAIETLKHALTIEPGYGWAWMTIRAWALESGKSELPIQLARELTERKPRDVRAWTNLAEMLESGAFSQEQLEAAEQALMLDPNYPTALAIKANCLADARRYDEAIAVCKTVMPDGHRPEQLQFVEAGIEAGRGKIRRSIEIVQALTRSSPGYVPGWSRLADYYRNDPGRDGDYLAAARELVRLTPRDATAYGYFAEACLKNDRKDEAREALDQAVILDPGYHYAAETLFNLLVEEKDTEGAERLAETLRVTSKEIGLPMAIELAADKDDRKRVISLLNELFLSPDVTKERTDRAFGQVAKLFGRKDRSLEDALRAICGRGDVNPLAGRYLIGEVWNQKGKSGCEEALSSVSQNRPLWAQAASRYMEIIAVEKPNAMMKFIDANSVALAEFTESWAAAGYHLTNRDDPKRTIKWYEGWQEREGVMPWMLWNYAIMLRRAKLNADADRINEAAIELPYDDSINLHLTSIGLKAFGDRRLDESRVIFSNINSLTMTNWERFFYDIFDDALAAADSAISGDKQSAKSIADGIVGNVVVFDRKMSDKIVYNAVHNVLNVILDLIGSKWYAFWIRTRLLYSRLG
jgi:cellulose synthase operon protein C